MPTDRFAPGTLVEVFFDRVTSFNGRHGVVIAIPAGIAPSLPDDVLVQLTDGSEAGRMVFFARYEIRPTTPTEEV